MRPTALRTLLFVALSSALVNAQGAAPPMPVGTNVLIGRVVEVGTGAPVSGAIVTLTSQLDASGKPATPSPIGLGPALPSLNVMTTAGGYFVFRNLPAGLFTTATRALGFVNSDFPATLIEIQNSQKPTEIELTVWKYVAIGGRVVDERGEPVAGMVVNALRRVTSGGRVVLQRSGTALTDDRGVYRIFDLTPGSYVAGLLSSTTTLPESVAAALDPSAANRTTFSAMRVELIQSGFARTYGCPTCVGNSHEGDHINGFVLQRPGMPLPPAPDGRLLGFANSFYPDASRTGEANAISLGSGESRTDLDFVVRLVPTVTASGIVTGPSGPLAHLALNLVPAGADISDFDMAGIATAITDAAGAFSFLAVVPGEYTLSSSLALIVSETRGEGQSLWASQPLNIDERGFAGLSIAMQPGLPMSGRVEFKGTAGVTNRPTDPQFLSLQPIGAERWRTIRAVAQADGTFRSAGDPPGRYTLNANSPPGWFWQTTSLAGRPVLDEVIELRSSEVSGLVLTFGQATNRVSGRVSDATGAADSSAAVIAFPADSDAWREGIFTSRRERKVYATSAGTYDIATLAPGDYYVAAIARRLALNWQDPKFLDTLIAGATRVTLGAEDQKAVPLRTIAPSGQGR